MFAFARVEPVLDASGNEVRITQLPPPGDRRGGQALLDVQPLGGRRFCGCLATAVAVDLANPASLDLTQGVLVAARQRRELLAIDAIELTILVGELLVHARLLRFHAARDRKSTRLNSSH